MSQVLSRRKVLRGMLRGSAVALGLPLLESMLNDSGTALAAGERLPVRYGLFFWGNGLPWTARHRGAIDMNFDHPLDESLVVRELLARQFDRLALDLGVAQRENQIPVSSFDPRHDLYGALAELAV